MFEAVRWAKYNADLPFRNERIKTGMNRQGKGAPSYEASPPTSPRNRTSP